MASKTRKVTVEFKDPDFIYEIGLKLSPLGESMGEFSEYYTIELEVDEDLTIHSARFIPRGT